MYAMDLKEYFLSFSRQRWAVYDLGYECCVAGKHQLALRSGKLSSWATMGVEGNKVDKEEKHSPSRW